MLPPDGAAVPASRILRINSGGTGSGFSRRIDLVVAMISNRSPDDSGMSRSLPCIAAEKALTGGGSAQRSTSTSAVAELSARMSFQKAELSA
jgi:hypothetical protein